MITIPAWVCYGALALVAVLLFVACDGERFLPRWWRELGRRGPR